MLLFTFNLFLDFHRNDDISVWRRLSAENCGVFITINVWVWRPPCFLVGCQHDTVPCQWIRHACM